MYTRLIVSVYNGHFAEGFLLFATQKISLGQARLTKFPSRNVDKYHYFTLTKNKYSAIRAC